MEMNLRRRAPLILLLVISGSCTILPANEPPTMQAPNASPTRLPATSPPSTTPAPLSVAIATATLPTLGPPQQPPPPGLSYCQSSLWVVRGDGSVAEIAPSCDTVSSPDSTRLLLRDSPVGVVDLSTGDIHYISSSDGPPYYFGCGWSSQGDAFYVLKSSPDEYWSDDIWRVHLSPWYEENLTNTPDRDESCPLIWPTPDLLLFGSMPAEDGPVPFGLGVPTAMTEHGEGYRVLAMDADMAYAELSPNGGLVALLGGYLLESPDRLLTLPSKSHQTGDQDDLTLLVPSWSPDGARLAWSAWTSSSPGDTTTAIYEVPGFGLTTMHTYSINMGDGHPPSPSWSPDGQWLALNVYGPGDYPAGLLVMSSDGTEEHFLGPAQDGVWAPDSQSIAAAFYSEASAESYVAVFSVNTWQPVRLALPDGSTPMSWLDTPRAGQTSTP